MKIKGFDKNLRCNKFQFEIGKEYKTNAKKCDLKLCSNTVFHYCNSIQNVHRYYSCDPERENRFCEIENLGDEIESEDKRGSNHIKILREIKGKELKELIGLTNGNSGLFNNGDENSGDLNNGSQNNGNRNNGNRNNGHKNYGHRNNGDLNNGNRNNGFQNNGDRNNGHQNSGNRNSGNRNSGNRNSGLFNSCNNSTGVFCNKEPTIKIFNVDSDMTFSQFQNSIYYKAITSASFDLTEWVPCSNKENISGGHLKIYEYKEACLNWWGKLSDDNKKIIQSIPNFDKKIFYDITGIEL